MGRAAIYIFCILVHLLCACRQTELQESLPSISDVSASVEENSVTLTARISGNRLGIVSCGFRYGVSDKEMVEKRSEIKDGVFSVTLTEFEYDTKYIFSAFISNGHNHINSEKKEFKTRQRRAFTISESYLRVPWSGGHYVVTLSESDGYEVVCPEDVLWVSLSLDKSRCTVDVAECRQEEPRSCKFIFRRLVDGSECELAISQEKIVYDLGLSSYESNLSYMKSDIRVAVNGNADFEVAAPDNVSWVDVSVNGRECVFSVKENGTTEPRECEIVVRSLDHDFTCSHKIVQQGIVYSLELSSYESRLSGDSHVVDVSVTGNVGWDMQILEESYWINVSVDGDRYSFFVDENASGRQRECEIVFSCADHGLSRTHRIIQAPSTKKCFDVEMTHSGGTFSIYIGAERIGYGWEDDWIDFAGGDSGYASFQLKENTSMVSRSETLRIYTDDDDYLINLTQHSYMEYLDFECPAVKSACVALWDRNGDGEISFEEAVAVTEITKDCFEGYDVSSFDELRFFINAFHWQSMPEYQFEGLPLTSVSLPHGLYDMVGRGAFKDCRNLERVDLGCRSVGAEAFMGCISLKEIDAAVNDEKAFMGCTRLERAVQKNNWVPDMAFKGCSSLRTFRFEQVFWAAPASIGREAFFGCTFLSEISDIPVDVEEICESAFSGCASLAEIRLQHKVKAIGSHAFYGCSGLKAVYLTSGVPPVIGTGAFEGTHPEMKFYVPQALVNIYKSNWPDLADRIEACD